MRKGWVAAMLISGAAAAGCASSEAPVAMTRPVVKTTSPVRAGWVLAWHDEFEGPAIDKTKWEVVTRKDSYNNELQYYLAEQASIVDGKLRLTATNEPLEGKKFRSGLLHGVYEQAYGRFECRARLPRGQGMWPAFWLLPRPANWPHRGEIDVLESKGSNTKWHSSAYHFADPKSKEHKYVVRERVPLDASGQPIDLADRFHTYAVEWAPGELKFFVDDSAEPFYVVTNKDAPVSDQPMHVILNLAVGGWFGGDPDSTTVFPQVFEVDWVRVWKKV